MEMENGAHICMVVLIVVTFPIVFFYNINTFEDDCEKLDHDMLLMLTTHYISYFAGFSVAVFTYEQLYTFDALCKSLQKC